MHYLSAVSMTASFHPLLIGAKSPFDRGFRELKVHLTEEARAHPN